MVAGGTRLCWIDRLLTVATVGEQQMAGSDRLVGVIESIYAAGADDSLWPDAILAAAHITGSRAGTLEVFDKAPLAIRELRVAGLPSLAEVAYVDHYARHNPRADYAFRHLSRVMLADYDLTDEPTMDRLPYYAEYLHSIDLRYFLSAQIFNTADQQAVITIQRTRRQGHVGAAEIAMMGRLLPHFRRARDMATRLKSPAGASIAEQALEWLSDGIALLTADGSVTYANRAFAEIAGAGDGMRLAKNRIELAGAAERAWLDAALAAAAGVRTGGTAAGSDFNLPRPSGAPPYLISVRPLMLTDNAPDTGARFIVFMRDPLTVDVAGLSVLQMTYGLTNAEADLARALQAGTSPAGYAHERAVSLNTVYTHLRRIKEKTRTRRSTELIQALNRLRLPLRDG